MELKNVTSDAWEFIIDHAEKMPQGVHLWYRGTPLPRRVYCNSLNDPNYALRALEALGSVKKFLFSLTFLSKVMIPWTFRIKKWDAFLLKLHQVCRWQLEPYYLKDDEWSEPVWEIGKFVKRFLINLGFGEDTATGWSKTLMTILEFDNAYRYRLQDIIGRLVNRRSFYTNPRKETKVLLQIYKRREGIPGAAEKVVRVGKLLSYALWIPKIKRALLEAIVSVDLNKVKFDKNDRFHISFWRGYDFEGKTFEQRFIPYEEIFKKIPFRKREDPQVTANFMTGE